MLKRLPQRDFEKGCPVFHASQKEAGNRQAWKKGYPFQRGKWAALLEATFNGGLKVFYCLESSVRRTPHGRGVVLFYSGLLLRRFVESENVNARVLAVSLSVCIFSR